MSEANTDRITPLPWKSWKTEMFNKHKTRGLDEWASGYNVGLDNGLQEAVEIYEQSAKLEALNAELVEALKNAQCGCSLKERMSGHLIDCWRPDVNELISRAEQK
jgi:hypothetical protein